MLVPWEVKGWAHPSCPAFRISSRKFPGGLTHHGSRLLASSFLNELTLPFPVDQFQEPFLDHFVNLLFSIS